MYSMKQGTNVAYGRARSRMAVSKASTTFLSVSEVNETDTGERGIKVYNALASHRGWILNSARRQLVCEVCLD